ncbi:MAG: hypothetical protein RR478_02265, partial [Bacilli bacterium]
MKKKNILFLALYLLFSVPLLLGVISSLIVPILNDNISLLFDFLMSILLTAISYMIIPLCLLKKRGSKFDDNIAKKIALINSSVLALIFMFISIVMYGDEYQINFLPAFFWGTINYQLLKKNNSSKKELKDENVEVKIIKSKNKKDKNTVVITSLSILLGFSFILNIYQLMNPTIKIKEKIVKEKLNYNVGPNGSVLMETKENYYETINSFQIQEMEKKIKFFDKHAVIVVDGYSSSASYDCWVRNGSPYPIHIYNTENA